MSLYTKIVALWDPFHMLTNLHGNNITNLHGNNIRGGVASKLPGFQILVDAVGWQLEVRPQPTQFSW